MPLPRSEHRYRMLEIGVIALSVVCFVVLDLYVLGCEKV
jgi:hypothetical protein